MKPAKKMIGKTILFAVVLHITHAAVAQKNDSTTIIRHFSGAVSVTNNGISLIPSFSLGKPAAIINLAVGGNKLSFEPELRFSLEGKPWSYIFWGRYKMVTTRKFALTVGAHPAIAFKTTTDSVNGAAKEVTVTRRYLAGEISPNYALAKHISVGAYYLYSHGMNEGATKNTHFFRLNGNFSDIRLTKQFFLRVTPQLYYLNMDHADGVYVASTIGVARKNFPLTLSAMINKAIQTDIAAGKDLVWNATLTYAFN